MKAYVVKTVYYGGDPPDGDTLPQYYASYSHLFTHRPWAETELKAMTGANEDDLGWVGSELLEIDLADEASAYPGVW